jgi:hypothetical protein
VGLDTPNSPLLDPRSSCSERSIHARTSSISVRGRTTRTPCPEPKCLMVVRDEEARSCADQRGSAILRRGEFARPFTEDQDRVAGARARQQAGRSARLHRGRRPSRGLFTDPILLAEKCRESRHRREPASCVRVRGRLSKRCFCDGAMRVKSFAPLSIRRCRFPGFCGSPTLNPLIENQRALPVFWKCPSVLVGRQGLEPWTR